MKRANQTKLETITMETHSTSHERRYVQIILWLKTNVTHVKTFTSEVWKTKRARLTHF